jgi:phosphate transport system protein
LSSIERPDEHDRAVIRARLVEMAVRAEAQLRLSVRAITERNAALARTVLDKDRDIDLLEMELDRAAIAYLAAHRPVGRELRFAAMVLKVVTDLERIGDLAGNVATRALELGVEPGLEPDQDMIELAMLTAEMVRLAADAFVSTDAEQARRVIRFDQRVDDLHALNRKRLLAAATAHPDQAARALALCLVCKDLERAADHAANIGEMVVYLVEGRDVRHRER